MCTATCVAALTRSVCAQLVDSHFVLILFCFSLLLLMLSLRIHLPLPSLPLTPHSPFSFLYFYFSIRRTRITRDAGCAASVAIARLSDALQQYLGAYGHRIAYRAGQFARMQHTHCVDIFTCKLPHPIFMHQLGICINHRMLIVDGNIGCDIA